MCADPSSELMNTACKSMADFANWSARFPHLAQIYPSILLVVWYSHYEDHVGELDILRAMFKGRSLTTKTYSEKHFQILVLSLMGRFENNSTFCASVSMSHF